MVAKAFFALGKEQKIAALAEYRIQYGEGAYSYAVESLSEWSYGIKTPNGQTLRRLLEAVLPSLPFSVKKDVIIAVRNVVLPMSRAHVPLVDPGWRGLVESAISEHVTKIGTVEYPAELTQAASWLTSEECDQVDAVMAALDMEEGNVIRSVWARDQPLIAQAVGNMERLVEDGKDTNFEHVLEGPRMQIHMFYRKEGKKKTIWGGLANIFTREL